MTDRLMQVIKLQYTDNADELPVDDQIVIDWMDDKAETLQKIGELVKGSPATLCMGEFDERDGEYKMCIDTCAWFDNIPKQVHIYQGLPILAKAVGAEISTRPYAKDGITKCHPFIYKGVEFFELTNNAKPLI